MCVRSMQLAFRSVFATLEILVIYKEKMLCLGDREKNHGKNYLSFKPGRLIRNMKRNPARVSLRAGKIFASHPSLPSARTICCKSKPDEGKMVLFTQCHRYVLQTASFLKHMQGWKLN